MKKSQSITQNLFLLLVISFFLVCLSNQQAYSQLSLIKDINPGPGGSNPRQFTFYNDTLVFTSNLGSWMHINDTTWQMSQTNFSTITEYNNNLYMYGWRRGIFEYDGTDINLLFSITEGPSSISGSFEAIVHNEYLYLVYQEGTMGCEILKFDGADTTKITNFNIPMDEIGSIINIGNLVVYNNALYFKIFKGDGTYLYRYNDNNVIETVGLISNADIIYMQNTMAVLGDKLYLSANLGDYGLELYSFDGNNFNLIEDISPGSGSSSPEYLTDFKDKLYFNAYSASGEYQYKDMLYSYNPNDNIVSVVEFTIEDISSSPNPSELTSTSDYLFFSAMSTDGTGYKLCVFDGVEVSLLKEAKSLTNPQNITFHGNTIYFSAEDEMHGREPWKYAFEIPSNIETKPDVSDGDIFKVFPNPAKDYFVVSFNLNRPLQIGVNIFDINGRKVKSIDNIFFNEGSHNIEIDLSGFHTGIYNVVLTYGLNVSVKKVIIVK